MMRRAEQPLSRRNRCIPEIRMRCRGRVLLGDFTDSVISGGNRSKPGRGRSSRNRKGFVVVRMRILAGKPPLGGKKPAPER